MEIVDDARTDSICVDVHMRKWVIADEQLYSQPHKVRYIGGDDHYASNIRLGTRKGTEGTTLYYLVIVNIGDSLRRLGHCFFRYWGLHRK